MKGIGRKAQGSYDVSDQGTRPAAGGTPTLLTLPGRDAAQTPSSSRQVTLQDILDLAHASSTTRTSEEPSAQHLEEPGDLDFESSRVIVVNTKSARRAPRKRSLSVSPRLGSRTSEVGSSCGSGVDGAGGGGGSSSRGAAGGFYTWMQSSLRRRLSRKRAKKCTLPLRQVQPSTPAALGACSCPQHHQHHHPEHHHYANRHHLEGIGTTLLKEEVVTSSRRDRVVTPDASPPLSCPHSTACPTSLCCPHLPPSSTVSPSSHSTPSSTTSPSSTHSHASPTSSSSPVSPSSPSSPCSPCSSSYLSCSSSEACSSSSPSAPSHPPHPLCASSPLHPASPIHPASRDQASRTQEDAVTYVNHRNGSVTAVSAASVLQALLTSASPSSSSSGAKHKLSNKGGSSGNRLLSHSTRHRSTSVGRRVALSTSVCGGNGTGSGTSGKKGGKKNKKGKRSRVFGGAWGLFHCAGAGARSRSCTPERNVNFRVRSRSATPERYVNVRVNPPPGGNGAGKKGKGPSMKGRSKVKTKSSRRRFSAESDDEEANKENKYDMWGYIKERLEWSGSGHRPCAAQRMSRRDTLNCRPRCDALTTLSSRGDALTCRPRGSVNINRDDGVVDFSPPDLPAVTRASSERRYDAQYPHHHHPHPGGHLPPQDTCTYIHRVPPTTDVDFSNYGSVLSVHLKRGETVPLTLQRAGSGSSSLGSSMTSVTSKESKDSGVGGSSLGGGSRAGSGRGGPDPPTRDRTSATLPARYRNRPLPPIPAPCPPPKPPESGIRLVKTLKLDKFMKNKWISGVSVTRKHDLVVVDLKEAYLIDEDGHLKRTLGAAGKGALKEPIDVSVMANGNVAFSDHADQEVKVFTTKGQFVRRVRDKCLANIAGVATTGGGRMYIAGTDKRCITVHSEEDGFLYSIPSTSASGSTTSASGGGSTMGGSSAANNSNKEMFEHPYSIAVNPLTGDVIVGDDYKQRVVALSPDGRVLWRYSPTGDRHFFPCSIAVDSEGYIFIADLYNEKVYMLDSSGKHLKVLLSRGEGLKGGPGAIAVDGRGHLVVADEERTLRVFKYGDKGFALYRRFSMCPDAK